MNNNIEEFDRQARGERRVRSPRRKLDPEVLWGWALIVLCLIGFWAVVALAIASIANGHGKPGGWGHASASWYGPGLYGNTMGCGGRLTPGTLGVAHKSMRCGTRLRICYRRCVTVRVVDRGPYVGGRVFDLTSATRYAIGFPNGVAVVRWRYR